MKSKNKAILYVIICVILWALIPVVSKLGQVDLDNHQFLFWSSLVSFLALLTSTLVTKKAKFFQKYNLKDWVKAVLLGFTGTYLYYILLYFGYANAQGIEILVLQYSWPIFIVLLSRLILNEKLNSKKILSLLFGFLGVILVLTKGNITQIHLDNYYIDILVLLAGLTFAIFSVYSKKVHLEPYTMTTIYFLTATIASFISMFWFSNFVFPTTQTLIPILVNGLLVNGFSYIFWVKALKESEASFIAPFVFLTPILGALYLIMFFREPMLPVYIIGLVAVIAGGLLNK